MNHSLSRLAIFAVFLSGFVSAQTTAIVGGTVHTVGAAGTIENATVIIENGIITAVGENVAAPSGATIINAAAATKSAIRFGSLTGAPHPENDERETIDVVLLPSNGAPRTFRRGSYYDLYTQQSLRDSSRTVKY